MLKKAASRGIDNGSILYYDAGHAWRRSAARVPADHPLRPIRQLVDDILRGMSRDFDRLYAKVGRPSIPPGRLLRAQLLQVFYSIRSERLLMEQLDYNILFRWFVGLSGRIDVPDSWTCAYMKGD